MKHARNEYVQTHTAGAEVGANKIVTTIKEKLHSKYRTEIARYADVPEYIKTGEFIATVIDIDDPEAEGAYTPIALRRAGIKTPLIGVARPSPVLNNWSDRKAEFLERGGDYLLKSPPNPRELDASISAVTRRVFSNAESNELRFSSGLVISLSQNAICYNGFAVKLTPAEASVARVLARSAGKVVTKDALLRGMYLLDQPNVKILDVYVCKIRAKLDSLSPGLSKTLETVWGTGYMMHK